MDAQKQVSNYIQSFELKRLGVKYHNPLYLWRSRNNGHEFYYGKPTITVDDSFAPAFTVAELAVMLPTYNWAIPLYEGEIRGGSDVCQEVKIQINILGKPTCNVVVFDGSSDYSYLGRSGETLAQAMAGLLIELLMEEVISVEDINKSLL